MNTSNAEAVSPRMLTDLPKPATAAVAVAALALVALTPLWLTSQYWMYLANTSITFIIIGIGLNITNGYLGVLNLAVAGQIAIGAYTCVLLTLQGVPVPLALVGGAAAGAVASAITFSIFGRLDGFFFGLSTLAVGEIVRLLLRNLDQWTNGVRGLNGYPPLTASQALSFWILLASVTVILLAVAIVIRSPVGIVWRAIRENPLKAASAGIRVRRQKLFGYTVGGAVISLGGAYLALLMQYIDPAISDLKMVVQTILMVALGGLGTLLGPVFGAVVINLLPELLRVANELRLIAYGFALIAVVLVLPGGLVGTVLHYKRVRRNRQRRQ